VVEILEDLMGLEICLGSVSNTEGRVNDALEEPVEEAKRFVQDQPTSMTVVPISG
jgi:hypothetical protein